MKLMVTGIGGVGGYIASVLCANYPDVTVVARKKRKDALIKNGLILHSDFFGEHRSYPTVTSDPASAGTQDIIFICVKNYSLPNALSDILPCVDSHTIVVLILNGVDHIGVARKCLEKGHIVDSAIYITSAYKEDFSILQSGKYARIVIGSNDAACTQKVFEVLNHEGLTCRIADDIQAELWAKYITNCAYNVITAYYEGNIGDVFEHPEGKEQFRTLLEEAYAVGTGLGIALDTNLVDGIYNRIVNQNAKNVTSSLARDIIHGHQSELETFSGYLVRTAHDLGIAVPFSETCYHAISSRIHNSIDFNL